MNKSWRQHPTRHQLYGHLPPITKTIQVRRTRHAGHCWRSRDELIRDVLLWTPTHGRAKAGWPARTYYVCPEDLPERWKRFTKTPNKITLKGLKCITINKSSSKVLILIVVILASNTHATQRIILSTCSIPISLFVLGSNFEQTTSGTSVFSFVIFAYKNIIMVVWVCGKSTLV